MNNPATLLEAWERTVRRAPEARAVEEVEAGRRCTRRQLDKAAEDWVGQHGRGLAGTTVVFAARNGVDWLTIFLGALKAGAIVAALDPGEPAAAQRSAARTIGAARLWAGAGWEHLDTARRARADGRRLIKLTSGSTGKPRALAFTDAQMLADGRQVCATMGIGPDDVNFGLIPFGHSYGLGNLVVPLLWQGTAVAVGNSPLPHAVAAEIERSRATVFPAVPALLRALVDSAVPPEKLAGVRTVISAGAPLDGDTARRFFERFRRKIHGFYGSSETGGICYDRTGEATLRGSVGTPMSGVRVSVGAKGTLRVTSAAVMTIGRRIAAGAWGSHRPADRAALGASGELTLMGRAGREVKLAGRRVNLSEIERVLREIPGVRDAWVAVQGDEAKETLVAAVAGEVTAGQLRDALREKLAAWKIPRRWCVLAELPRTARGKVDVGALRERFQNRA